MTSGLQRPLRLHALGLLACNKTEVETDLEKAKVKTVQKPLKYSIKKIPTMGRFTE